MTKDNAKTAHGKIIIGTRGSKLALIQSGMVKEIIEKSFPDITAEIKIIKTKGDKILDSPLSEIGDKGLFTREIEQELQEGSIDIAVHSLKDLPTELPAGLTIGAVLKREDPRDVLISKSGKKLMDLPEGSVIGTSSLRRKAQLLNMKRGFIIKDIRGNIETRVQKLDEGQYDAIILAGAGIIRAGMQNYITEFLSADLMLSAVSQGIIGIEMSEKNTEAKRICESINDPETMLKATAERAFLKTMEGGCQVPVGCLTEIQGSKAIIRGLIAAVDGTELIKEEISGYIENINELAVKLAQSLLDKGGSKIMKEIYR